jgi:hypothetical protein
MVFLPYCASVRNAPLTAFQLSELSYKGAQPTEKAVRLQLSRLPLALTFANRTQTSARL